MSKVRKAIIDGRGREQKEGLRPHAVVQQIIKLIVARWLICCVCASSARIAKMMRLINDHDIRKLGDPLKPVREIAFAA